MCTLKPADIDSLDAFSPRRAATFVQALYRDTAGRAASASETNGLSALLASGGRSAVVCAVLFSEESIIRNGHRLFKAFLNRLPTAGEEARWVNALRAGQALDKVMAGILGSDEYLRRAKQRFFDEDVESQYIQALYTDLLGRRATDAEARSTATKLQNGRSQAALAILRSVEYRTRILVDLYRHLLDRTPDDAEIRPWITWVNSAVDLQKMRMGVLASDEYFDRWATQ